MKSYRNKKIMNVLPHVRRAKDMEHVIYDRQWLKSAADTELYFMYRKVKEGKELVENITIIPALMMGEEFVKTKGHYHLKGFGELYTVLEGTAIFLLQKRKDGKDDQIEDAYYVKAEKGDYVVMPPHYAHIIINPGKEELRTADWSFKECESDYKPIMKLGGACYFYARKGWIKNKNYSKVPELRFKKPTTERPEDLSFLYGGSPDTKKGILPKD